MKMSLLAPIKTKSRAHRHIFEFDGFDNISRYCVRQIPSKGSTAQGFFGFIIFFFLNNTMYKWFTNTNL